MLEKQLPTLLLLLALTGIACGDKANLLNADQRPDFQNETELPVPAVAHPKISGRNAYADSLPPVLRNTDFETTNPDGNLSEWNMFREAYYDSDSSVSQNGIGSVRSSFLFGWWQDLEVPVSPFQSFAVAGHAWREGEWERAGVRGVYYDPEGGFIREENPTSPVNASPGLYGDFWATQEVPERAGWMSLFLRGEQTQSWLRFDNLTTYSEQLRPSTSPGAWSLSGGAAVDAAKIYLPAGSSAAQLVAVGPENQAYFLWGKYSAAGETEITVSEQWLPRAAGETTATASSVHTLSAPGGIFLSDLGRPPGQYTGKGRILLQVGATGAVEIESLRRGFAKVEPQVLTAGPASPDGSLKLTAALPEYLSTATIELIHEGTFSASPTTVTLYGTSVRAEWDPADAPGGDYLAKFNLEANDGESVVVERPFQVLREDTATSYIPPSRDPTFTRGIWLFVTGTPGETMAMFESLKADGFNFALVLANVNRLSDVRQAAEQNQVPFIVFAPEATTVFRDYERRSWFSKADYLARMKQMFSPVSDSDMFRGVYVVDEPSQPVQFDLVRKAFLSLVQDGTLGTPYTTFIDSVPGEVFEQIEPPVPMVDTYPFHLDSLKDGASEILRRIPIINQKIADARALGRDLWLLPQGFLNMLNYDGYYPVPNSLHTAQLASLVMAGARGTLPFFYSSTGGTMEGLRWPGLTPTEKLIPYQRFNVIAERIGPLLMQLEVPEVLPAVPHPLAVSVASTPGGERYVFVLNADEAVQRTLVLNLSGALHDQPFDIVGLRSLLSGPGNEVTVALGPGEWALFSIGTYNVENVEPVDVSEPVHQSSVDLPISHIFEVTGLQSNRLPVRALDFDVAGTALAATVPFHLTPSEPQVYSLNTSGTASRVQGPAVWLFDRNGYSQDDLQFVASPLIGIEFYSDGSSREAPVSLFKGRTGGGYDTIMSGNTRWLSLDIGIRHLEETSSGLVSKSVGWANRGNYLDLFGPFDDGSVSVLVSNYSISNIKPGHLHEFAHHVEFQHGIDRNADINDTNLLAAPRHQRGVALFQLNADGEAQLVGNIAEDAQDAMAVAWVTDNILAVADGYRSVRFYRVSNYNGALIATWRPPLPDYFYMLSLAVRGDRLAVGMRDGRVMVADLSPLFEPASVVDDWSLYIE